MRVIRSVVIAVVLTVALGIFSELWMRGREPATSDERAVLASFLPTLQNLDCQPPFTTPNLHEPIPHAWVEVDEKEGRRLDLALRHASERNVRLPTEVGWMRLAERFVVSPVKCTEQVRVSNVAFYQGLAFVAAASDRGVSTSAFERREGRWGWVSSSWHGEAITQY